MRSKSFFFSCLLHFVVIMALLFSARLTSNAIRVDLRNPVYEVQLVNKNALPGSRKSQPKVIPKPKPKPKAKPISPKKQHKPEKKPKPKPKPKKKESTKEDILAKEMKDIKDLAEKEKQDETRVLDDALAEVRKQAGTTNGTTQGSGAGQGYGAVFAALVGSAIKSNWRYPTHLLQEDLQVEVEIEISGTGKIVGSTNIISSSARPDFDASVLRAIEDTQEIPAPADGKAKKVKIIFNSNEIGS